MKTLDRRHIEQVNSLITELDNLKNLQAELTCADAEVYIGPTRRRVQMPISKDLIDHAEIQIALRIKLLTDQLKGFNVVI